MSGLLRGYRDHAKENGCYLLEELLSRFLQNLHRPYQLEVPVALRGPVGHAEHGS